jgi:hypothetical protein
MRERVSVPTLTGLPLNMKRQIITDSTSWRSSLAVISPDLVSAVTDRHRRYRLAEVTAGIDLRERLF